MLYAVHERKKFSFKIQFGCSSFFWHVFDFTVHSKGKFNPMRARHLNVRVGDMKAELNAW
jgi:hypothetical protein